MTKIIVSTLLLICAGCSTWTHVPIPDESWTYAYSEKKNPDYVLRLSLATTDGRNLGIHEFQVDMWQLKQNEFAPDYPMNSYTVFGDGPTGYANISSSVNFEEATPEGVSIYVQWSRHAWEKGTEENSSIDQTITIPFTKKGSSQREDLIYSWQWIRNPNQRMEPTR